MHFSTAFTAAAVFALAQGAALTSRAISGKATFYGGNVSGGTCSFVGYTIQSGLYGVAMNLPRWENSKACGACVQVTGPKGNKIVAQVVDQCPECDAGHLDLFQNAFAQLDDISKGIIPITWDFVNCPITTPLQVRNKEGTSPYWFSMQVINANKRVESLHFSTNGGATWIATVRQFYNYFEYSAGSRTSVVDVKVTSINGDVVIVKNVAIGGSIKATASSNFPNSASAPVDEPVAQPTSPVPAVAVAVKPAVTQAPAAAQPVQAQPIEAPEVSNPVTPTPDAVKPAPDAPVEQEVEAPVSTTVPEPSAEDDCSEEPEAESDIKEAKETKEIKALAAIATTLATLSSKPTLIASPVPTASPTKAPAVATTTDVTVTVTITGCPAPTSTSTNKVTKRNIFKQLFHF